MGEGCVIISAGRQRKALTDPCRAAAVAVAAAEAVLVVDAASAIAAVAALIAVVVVSVLVVAAAFARQLLRSISSGPGPGWASEQPSRLMADSKRLLLLGSCSSF